LHPKGYLGCASWRARLGFARIAIGFALLTGLPATAFGYVRVLSSTGNPMSWYTSCVAFSAYAEGLLGPTVEQFGGAVTAAAQSWSRQDPTLAACTYLDLQVALIAATVPALSAKFDQVNSVVFVGQNWPADRSALAQTLVFSRASGQIVDTDIEINAVDFVWSDLVSTPIPGNVQDLQNAVTHEMGHAIGLGHTCQSDASQPRPTDQNGAPIPDCASAPAAVRETTMFPSANPRDTSKRSLSPDDQQAVCDSYPLAADPHSCAADAGTPAGTVDASVPDAGDGMGDAQTVPSGGANGNGCGCATTGGGNAGAAGESPWLFCLAAVIAGARRRRLRLG
jgi:Metallo-peptidase family M12